MRIVGRRAAAVLVMLLVVPAISSAQFRGLGRITGTVTSDAGEPLKGVNVRAKLDGSVGVIEATSDEKGAWLVAGMGKGEWHFTFQTAGYTPLGAKVVLLAELARVPPIAVVLKKVSSRS